MTIAKIQEESASAGLPSLPSKTKHVDRAARLVEHRSVNHCPVLKSDYLFFAVV